MTTDEGDSMKDTWSVDPFVETDPAERLKAALTLCELSVAREGRVPDADFAELIDAYWTHRRD